MKCATAYLIERKILVHPSSKTVDGVWILSEPVTCLDDSAPNEVLGRALADALQRSVTGVAHPTQWKGLFEPVLRLAGIKTWSSFARQARSVEIEMDGSRIMFVPTKNLGADEGVEPISGKSLTTNAEASLVELGDTLRQALALAE